MDAERILSDAPTLRSFMETFVDLTTANIEAQQVAVARLRALLDGEPVYAEVNALAKYVEVGDGVLIGRCWRTVSEVFDLPNGMRHFYFADGGARFFSISERFKVRREVGGPREGTPAA